MSLQRFTIGVATPEGMGAPYAYFTPAITQGFDRAEGLAFEFFAGGEPGATARALSAGACDIACLNTIVGFMGRANEDLPMVAIGSKARREHRYFAVPASSPITALAELKGKRIACDFPHVQPLAEAALVEEGAPSGSFTWSRWHGSGMEIAGMVEPLGAGAVDALFIMDWTHGDAVARGVALRHLRSRLFDRIRVSSCYWTTETRLAADPDSLGRALRAIQKSLVFAFTNPGAALRAMWRTHPRTEPTAAARDAVFAHDIEILQACLEPMRIAADDPDPRWCAIPAAEMDAWHGFLCQAGSIRRPVDLPRLYTTALVAHANDFDAEPVRATARRAEPEGD
jgi:ABC-type nitrate/sulfonate/bicarbonate transport system substrate-binding protein